MVASRHTFKIHSFDTDAFGHLTAPSLLGYHLEAAGRSADSLGFGVEKLQAQNLTWVLARIKIVLREPLHFGEQIEVETWPSGLVRSAFTRDFRIFRSGVEIGQSSSIWFVLNMETRLPVRANDFVPAQFHSQSTKSLLLSRSIPALAALPTVQHQFDVRLADIDLNRHVTAASYIAWAMEAVPESVWKNLRLTSMDVNFLEECLHGERVLTASLEEDPTSRLHRISRHSDGREIARLRTTWEPRVPHRVHP